MIGRRRRFRFVLVGLVTALAASLPAVDAQQRPAPPSAPKSGGAHTPHGTPKGWRFTLPRGDAVKGREVFAKLECYSCHEVKGETFPAATDKEKVGPELASMAAHHPREFFAESIINPNAVIDRGMGYVAADGSSKMPSFSDSLTVQELIDLVAYLKALKPPPAASGRRGHSH
jgi:cytochrome c1